MGTDAAIGRRAFRQVRTSAATWGLVFGATVAASALSYVASFPDRASRLQLAATTGRDAGISILLGPVAAIDTVGGYTVYKCYVFLTTIGALWGLLAATRLLRGEEDSGRWQLVLAGGTRASWATLATLAALGAGVGLVFAGTTLITLAVGRDPDVGFGVGATVLYGLGMAVAPAVFAAVGALSSQLSRSRRQATGLGMAVFGVALVLRMIADSAPATRWLLWVTPFGWIERMRPFTGNDALPLALAVVVVAALVAATALLASRRDAGDGFLASRDVAAPRPFGLGTPFGLAVRLESAVVVAWCAGAGATGLALGIVAKVATGAVPSSVGDTLARFGVQGSFLRQFFGVAFLLMATVVALLPAGQIGAASEEETSGRLVHLLVGPAGRAPLLAARLALGAAAVAVAGLLAGIGAWLGAVAQGVDPGLGAMVGAGLNVVPIALVVLGIGATVLAVRPRLAARSVYAVVIWSLLVDLVGSMVPAIGWLGHLSLFHYMALAPAEGVDGAVLGLTLAAAAALCVAAMSIFARRDVGTG